MIKSKINLIAFAVILILISCEPPKKQEEANPIEEKAPLTPFEKSLDFHGGLDNWNSFGTLKFNRISQGGVAAHVIDLKNRNEIIKSEKSTLAFGSEGYWTDGLKSDEAEKLEGMRFQRNLWFYFFSLPFVTTDPGANQEQLTDGVLSGKEYNRVKITFGENVGDAPDDQYILWLNKESRKLEMINYSVTYYSGKEASENYNAIVFTEWQEANGLTVPKKFDGYKWSADTLGELRYQFEFGNVSFEKDRPADDLFTAPENVAYLTY